MVSTLAWGESVKLLSLDLFSRSMNVPLSLVTVTEPGTLKGSFTAL